MTSNLLPLPTLENKPNSICAIATTPAAFTVLTPFCSATQTPLWIPPALVSSLAPSLGLTVKVYEGTLRQALEQLWPQHQALVFSLATGAVVRLIAPLLGSKATDPAVVVVDEAGQFAISLCGGHQGGADQLARTVAHYLEATPVLTGSAHHRNLPGIDVLGAPWGWVRGAGNWTGVSAAIARNQPVQVLQEAGSALWQSALPAEHPFQFGWPEETNPTEASARVWISPIQRRFAEEGPPKVQWHPRVLWVGIGCERGTSQALIDLAITQVFAANHLAVGAIAGIATLDLKADEAGLVGLCQERGWPLRCFSSEQLKLISVPNPSSVVENAVGTPSVAEAAALTAAHSSAESVLAEAPQTANLAELRVTKQVIRHEDQPGAVTVAVAQADQEYTGRTGNLWLVGTGPGSLDQITPAAKAAISQADAVIGYALYVDLIRPLLRPGQIVEALPITQERQRAERAIALAHWGLTVAVISSGDCGIYGMAGLVLEQLKTLNWDGIRPGVQVFPGISALQSAAARVGAPLMHDFCAISLSDLLTPWDVIQRRLEAAAQADFVVALYNPKSKTRTQQIEVAQEIFLRYRAPETSVALVQSVYRPEESVQVTTLAEMLQHPIDMLTTVLIGNRSTFTYAGRVITPRGYLGQV
ncbi:precorrin-3B C(17)-methyltransferase [Pseudanabaena sp. FACHB-2040]|uniref:precorrin-3B C(17)-methyltransferase n=1 Tax=Pseudanabaena sp. FACHB-2040 TaxID=2692859 RepID=UPI0016886B7A|nr:precorrin-3B C(17)-methyltransferase [Pseudanabaena sp. FACHB-2040]MBD2256711.1 precorrin-3B C(17)-methyltransferase [Pseudanabaena sp. FACHB-2040]